ncbi:MAG: YicC/YloC family endoribonuclease [Acidobacteriota bacterium]
MTGFGQANADGERVRAQATVRTVNHRYLDLVLRLSDELRPHERRLRDVFAKHLERGRVEATLDVERRDEPAVRLVPHGELISGVRRLLDELGDDGFQVAPPTFSDLLRLPDALRVESEQASDIEADLDVLEAACEKACRQVVSARAREGVEIENALRQRIDALEAVHAAMTERAAGMPARLAESLGQRIEQLVDERVDADRLAQEVAHLVDRGDVAEELDRLASHLVHFREMLAAEGAVGKRLDFLAQEIFRELNTVGSKCRDSDMTRSVLDGKVLCEQLREQVQNVE